MRVGVLSRARHVVELTGHRSVYRLPRLRTVKLRKIIKLERGLAEERARQRLTLPDLATSRRTATPSGPHSQHRWRCRKYDATPSLCLSLHRWRQLEDLPAESPRSTTAALSLTMVDSESSPRALALAVTARSLRSMAESDDLPGTSGPGQTLPGTLVSSVDPLH